MKNARLAANLSPQDQANALATIQTLMNQLDQNLSLTAAERRELPSVGEKRLAFVERAILLGEQYPSVLPANFPLPEIKQDLDYLKAVYPVWLEVMKLQEMLYDLYLVAGSESYRGALLVKSYLESASRLDPSYVPALHELNAFFEKDTDPEKETPPGE